MDELGYWKGTVDGRLEALEKAVKANGEKIDQVLEMQTQMANGDRFVSWSYLRDRITVPVVLGFIMFVLFTVMPSLVVAVWVLTKGVP